MSELACERLARIHFPLVDKFYRGQGAKTRARRDEQVWVARQDGVIVGALRLRPCAGLETLLGEPQRAPAGSATPRVSLDGHWMLGVFTAPPVRKQGIARQLIGNTLAATGTPVWLFCHPCLGMFYSRLGFTPAETMPEALASRLARYRQSQVLEAWEWPAVSLQGAGAPCG